jgi:predicted transglutaminase-like cysteine proteinase
LRDHLKSTLPAGLLAQLIHAKRRSQFLAATLACALAFCFWPSVALDDAQLLSAAARLSPHAVVEARALLQAIEAATRLDETPRLSALNSYINQRIAFRNDMEVWGQLDYWASPLESLDKGRGDCEDYAVAKYFSLVAAGTPAARLRLVYVRAWVGGQSVAHMVLAYYAQADAEPLILDNLVPDLRPASQRPDLQPVFSFNAEGLWRGVGAARAGDPMARLSQWRDVMAKARGEGF